MNMKKAGKLSLLLMTLLLVLAMTAGCASGAAGILSASSGRAAKTGREQVLASTSGGIEIVSSTNLAKRKKNKNNQNSQNQQNNQSSQNRQNNQNQQNNQNRTQQTTQNSGAKSSGSSKDTKTLDEKGTYTTKEDVALYIHLYRRLPDNFITKKRARDLGWEGGYLEPFAPGKCIGGDYFGNFDGILPDGNYRECDIDTLGRKKRGAKRIIYSDRGDIYYTEDHYETFTLLYTKNGPAAQQKTYGSKY